jgi:hypothetical protein
VVFWALVQLVEVFIDRGFGKLAARPELISLR